MFPTNKKGFEFSISFLVGLIMGIVLFGLGLVFIFNIVNRLPELDVILPDYFETEAKSCANRGERVCVPLIKEEVQTRKTASFGVVVNNNYGEAKTFKTFVKYSRGVLKDDEEAPMQVESEWTFPEYDPVFIKNNEYEIIGVPLRPPSGTQRGTYVFNINICLDSDSNINEDKCDVDYPSLYGSTNQVSVEVT